MSLPPAVFVTYVWHYLLARLLYDDLLRPLAHGRVPPALLLAAVAGVAFGVGRRSRRGV
jgi:hypothetical protein